MRKYIVHTLTLLSYVASIYYLFVDFKIRIWVAAMVVFFVLYHLTILDTPHFHSKYAGKIFLGIVILWSAAAILLWYDWTTSVALALLHIGIRFVGNAIYESIDKHVSFLIWDFNLSGLGIRTMCITFVPLILGIGMLHTIPVDCSSIRFDQLTNYIESKYKLSEPVDEKVDLVGALGKTLDTLDAGESQWMAYLLSELNVLKNQTLNQILNDRANVQGQVCNSIITEANTRLQQPWFQVSAIFLLFIVVYPVMWIIMLLASTIGTILLSFLLRIGVYKKSLEPVQAERIV
jgi:hypothetical protein